MSTKKQPANKILRIGLFQNKNCLEERLIHSRKPVHIGQDFTDKRNTFVVPVSNVPRSFNVFDVNKDGFVLRFTSDMSGRVSMADGKAKKLGELVREGKAKKNGDVYEVPVDVKTFGRVAFGEPGDEVALLFQFVKPPPPRPKPVLPSSMRAGLMYGLLGATTLAITTAVSGLFQIGFVAFLLSRDWPEPKDLEYNMPDRFVSVLVDKEKEEPPEPEEVEGEEVDGPGDEEAEETDAKPKSEEPDPEPKKDPKTAEERAAAEAERKRRLAEEVQNKTILGQIGAVSSEGGSLVDTLSSGAGKTSMEEAFANSQGVQTGVAGAEKSGLRTSGSSDAEGKAVGIGNLSGMKGASKAKEGVETGSKAEKKVKVRVNLKTPEKMVGGTLDSNSVSQVLRRRSKRLQRCYEREVKKNPGAAGKVIVSFTIGNAGRVTASKAVTDSVGGGVGRCVANAIQRMRFPRPKGGEVMVNKTFVFETSQ